MNNHEQNLDLVKISSVTDPLFAQASKLLEESFEANQRREFTRELLTNQYFSLYVGLCNNEFLGFQSIWDFHDFILVEHAAIRNDLRGLGLGSKLYKMAYELYPGKLFIYELERPDTESARKRIEFNRRLGCVMNSSYDYIQPPYSKDKTPVPMCLNSYPRAITDEEYVKIKNTIYEHVYHYPSIPS